MGYDNNPRANNDTDNDIWDMNFHERKLARIQLEKQTTRQLFVTNNLLNEFSFQEGFKRYNSCEFTLGIINTKRVQAMRAFISEF